MPKIKKRGPSAKIEPLSREHFTFRKVRPRVYFAVSVMKNSGERGS